MTADLQLRQPAAGDLTLSRDRPATGDLWLQRQRSGDLRLTPPPERQAALHGWLTITSGLSAELKASTAQLDAGLPPLASWLSAEYGARAELTGALPMLSVSVEAAYDTAVFRGIIGQAETGWQPGAAQQQAVCSAYQSTQRVDATVCERSEPGELLRAEIAASWQTMDARHVFSRAVADPAVAMPAITCGSWNQLLPMRQRRCAVSEQGIAARAGVCLDWVQLIRTERPKLCGRWQTGTGRGRGWRGDYQQAWRTRHSYCWPWQTGMLRTGWGGPIVIPAPPVQPVDDCTPVGVADLLLRYSRSSDLILLPCDTPPETGAIIIPALRAYVVVNDAHLVRVSDGLELPVIGMSLSIDAESWCWQLSAQLPADQLQYVEPGTEPVEVEVTVNTYSWRFLVERIRRERSFGRSEIRIGGRSIAARLAAPYAAPVSRSNNSDLNATQILDDLLTDNGVPIGWTVDWQLTDWLVTDGAWSHNGTYLEGVRAVAEAAGAIVQADRTTQTLHLLHRYPVAPWDWSTATPAYVVPEAIVTTEGITWAEKPDYNAAYVSGESQGIVGHCVRAGTAGDLVAPQIVHPLITAQDAARQRGLAVLADTGRQERINLAMPLSPADYGIGLMEPTLLIEYGAAAKRGLVRSTRIDVRRAEVRQTISLETRQ